MRTKSIEAATKVAYVRASDTTVVEYQPGNGSRYVLVFTQLVGTRITNLTPGQRVQDAVDDLGLDGCFTVALMNDGSGTVMSVRSGGFLSAGYVAEKLRVGPGDARVLAEIIAQYTGKVAAPADVDQ